jgi:hypothetical protein
VASNLSPQIARDPAPTRADCCSVGRIEQPHAHRESVADSPSQQRPFWPVNGDSVTRGVTESPFTLMASLSVRSSISGDTALLLPGEAAAFDAGSEDTARAGTLTDLSSAASERSILSSLEAAVRLTHYYAACFDDAPCGSRGLTQALFLAAVGTRHVGRSRPFVRPLVHGDVSGDASVPRGCRRHLSQAVVTCPVGCECEDDRPISGRG